MTMVGSVKRRHFNVTGWNNQGEIHALSSMLSLDLVRSSIIQSYNFKFLLCTINNFTPYQRP